MSVAFDWARIGRELVQPERARALVEAWLRDALEGPAGAFAGVANLRICEFELGGAGGAPEPVSVELLALGDARDEIYAAAGRRRSIHARPPTCAEDARAISIDAAALVFDGTDGPEAARTEIRNGMASEDRTV